MATQIVMDHSGDTRHWFDQGDSESLLKAEERFRHLSDLGYTAAVRSASGDPTIVLVLPALGRRLTSTLSVGHERLAPDANHVGVVS
jgi:hypothetical protein